MFNHADSYINTTDWEKRLTKEIPLIKEFIDSVAQDSTISNDVSVLDIGCGPGKHLNALSELYPQIKFLGLDKNAEYIAYAEKTKSQTKHNSSYSVTDFLEDDLSHLPQFDVIYSLGNSLMLMWGDQSPDVVFERIARLLKPGGILFFQILNSNNPRKGYFVSKIAKNAQDLEFFTAKRFDVDENQEFTSIEFLTFFKSSTDSRYNLEKNDSRWRLCPLSELSRILASNELDQLQFWGNYQKKILIPKTSDSLLCYAVKKSLLE